MKIAKFLIFTTILFFSLASSAMACEEFRCEEQKSNESEYLTCLSNKRSCLEAKISEVQSQKNTLSSTISVISSKISVQELLISQSLAEIAKLEGDISLLSERIETLNFSLDQLTSMLLKRVREQYKSNTKPTFFSVLGTKSFSETITQSRYVNQASQQTVVIMKQAEIQRILFDQQKEKKQLAQELLEKKRTLLEQQRLELNSQKAAQQKLLQQTNNSESAYQRQLAAVAAEYQAIQAIIAGNGNETKVGEVKKGDRIASVISGASCNSSSTHLHFTVTDGKNVVNPFSYLSSIEHKNCSGSSCGSADADPFNPSGDWSWPIPGPITLSQGYGSTWGIRHTWVSRIYSFHNGIDINGSSTTISAIADGTLYRGSFSGSGGCSLRYVKLEHSNTNITTWYLHINY